jgi:RNA polymerase sigma factor (sigma-70 family)
MDSDEPVDLAEPPEADMSDVLMEAYLTNPDKEVFIRIHGYFENELRQFFTGQLHGPFAADVEDMMNQTFFELYEMRNRLRSDPAVQPGARLRALLYQIAGRNAKNLLEIAGRQKRDYRKTEQMWGENLRPRTRNETEEQGIIDRTTRTAWARMKAAERLHDLMETLPTHHQTALRLVWLERYTEPEAAKIMGKPLSTIKWWIADGKDRMRKIEADAQDDQ